MKLPDNFHREIVPVSQEDLFVVLDRPNAKFDYPMHYHPEYELNLVIDSKGKRIVGDSVNDIRIGHASQMLFGTTHSIAEICYSSGFNNISNFIRAFKLNN
jgi:hypothetical protein